MKIPYYDTVNCYIVSSTGYSGVKTITDSASVPATFLQNTAYTHTGFQEGVDSDAVCYVDPTNQFIIDNSNRLEGMYILAELFGVAEDDAWFKVTNVNVNRDHLLQNQIDNIQLDLKKTVGLPQVS